MAHEASADGTRTFHGLAHKAHFQKNVPTYVSWVSDNGPQFVSEEFAKFMKSNGIHHIRSAPYHAATNGLAERMVETFKNSLKS